MDGHVLHEPHGGGVLVHILVFQLVQHVPQGGLVLHHAHGLAVYHHLALAQGDADVVELAVEIVLNLVLAAQVGLQGEGELIADVPLDLIVIAQEGGALGLYVGDGLVHHLPVRDHAHLLPVHGDGIAGCIEGGEGQGHAQGGGDHQKGGRADSLLNGQGAVGPVGRPAQMDAGPVPGQPPPLSRPAAPLLAGLRVIPGRRPLFQTGPQASLLVV